MALRLHKAAHYAQWTDRSTGFCVRCQSRDNGVIRPFSRRQRVRRNWIQAEVMPAVLQTKSPSLWHNPCAKPHIIAGDKRAGISGFIDRTEIDRVADRQRLSVINLPHGSRWVD